MQENVRQSFVSLLRLFSGTGDPLTKLRDKKSVIVSCTRNLSPEQTGMKGGDLTAGEKVGEGAEGNPQSSGCMAGIRVHFPCNPRQPQRS